MSPRVAEQDRVRVGGRRPVSEAPTDAWSIIPIGGRDSRRRGLSLAQAMIAQMYVGVKGLGENAGSGRIDGEKWRRRGDMVGRVWGWVE